MHLFISYAKNDTRDLALALTDAINGIDGLTAWVDKTLKAGKSWELQIQSEIDKCDTMIVLYSPDINRHKSGQEESYVLTEIHYAKRIAKKRIIPVMAVPTDPPMSLALEQYIDYTIGGLTLADLIDALCSELGIVGNSKPLIEPRLPDSYPLDQVHEALERARTFTGKRNGDWISFITTFPDLKIPDMPFCLVPVGSFQMGEGEETHPQTIRNPYYIAQYPVTNAQWALAVRAGVVRKPEGQSSIKWYYSRKMTNTPVVGVSWFEAKKFADWMGCHLPSEMEWEYAARGVENWVFPWGDEWKPDFAIWSENSGEQPHPVSILPEGASWVGARHMSGNVWNWTNSADLPYPYSGDNEGKNVDKVDVRRVIRSGSWGGDGIRELRPAAWRTGFNPDAEVSNIGFRLARSL